MERESTPARSRSASSVRPAPCVLWVPADRDPPQGLVSSLHRLGLKVHVARHRYEAIAMLASLGVPPTEVDVAVDWGGSKAPAGAIALVLVEPAMLSGVPSVRDALARLERPVARWRYDPSCRPALARDIAPSMGDAEASSDVIAPIGAGRDTDSAGHATPAGWLRLVHDDEQGSEPAGEPDRPNSGDRGERAPDEGPDRSSSTAIVDAAKPSTGEVSDARRHKPVVVEPASGPGTPRASVGPVVAAAAPTQQAARAGIATGLGSDVPGDGAARTRSPERVTLSEDELAMLLADDDEFRRLERQQQQTERRPLR